MKILFITVDYLIWMIIFKLGDCKVNFICSEKWGTLLY